MKVETQNVSPCRVKVIVDLDADEVRGDYNEVVNIFMKRGSVRGFRAGHVPRAIIVKSFDGQIKEEVSNRIFRKFSSKAIEDQNLKPYALLNIEDFDLKPETGAKFILYEDGKKDNKHLLFTGRQLIRGQYISVLFELDFIAFAQNLLPGFTE